MVLTVKLYHGITSYGHNTHRHSPEQRQGGHDVTTCYEAHHFQYDQRVIRELRFVPAEVDFHVQCLIKVKANIDTRAAN